MKTSKYWERFILKYVEEFNIEFPKRYLAEFTKNKVKYKVELNVFKKS